MSLNHKEYKQYELLIKTLHERILEKEGFEKIEVQHDVKIQGKTTTKHQIDVFWSQIIDNEKINFCIECKNWNSKVEQGDLLKFKAVLDDIGNAKGIFVTKGGFQSGAQTVAKYHDIILIQTDIDMKNYKSRMEFHICNYKWFNLGFGNVTEDDYKILKEWMAQEESLGRTLEALVYNKDGEVICNIEDLIEKIKADNNLNVSGIYSCNVSDLFIKIEENYFEITYFECEFETNHNSDLDLHAVTEVAEIVANYIFENRQELFSIEKDSR